MQHQAARTIRGGLAAIATALSLAACGGSDLSIGASPTVTLTPTSTAVQTATATPLPTNTPIRLAQVAGLVLVGADVHAGSGDGLATLGPDGLPPRGKGFDRALGAADWYVDDGSVHGTTDDGGRFSVGGLTAGRHVLHFAKTVDGNLMEFAVPIVVGDDGAAAVLAEVSWGLVRSTSTYTQGGAAARAVFAPNGTYLITRSGAAVELFDGWRTLVDADGDGHFDPQSCGGQLYGCRDDGGCASPEDICLCIPSCPTCEDCGRRACVPRPYLQDPACGPDGLCKSLPYACSAGADQCEKPGDQCSCVASCPVCDDCQASACIAPCAGGEPIDILQLTVFAPERLVVGRESGASASLVLSDGSGVDVTWLATWGSSAPAVVSVDSWGRLSPVAAGTAELSAALLGVTSAARPVTVVERPALSEIIVQNASCTYPPDDPRAADGAPPAPGDAAFLPSPWCSQVLRIGATAQLSALGRYEDGSYEDLTNAVAWSVAPAAVGAVADGRFTAAQVGDASLSAALAGIESNVLTLKVVDQPTIVDLSVYPSQWANQYLDGGPVRADGSICFECGYFITLLRGDTVKFSATAHYDTGEWEDVTARVTWTSSDRAVLAIDDAGSGSAVGGGDASVTATLGAVTSSPLNLRVVNQATLQSLFIYQDGGDRVVGVGGQAVFHAVGYYDVGFERDVTGQAVWRSSDPSLAAFATPGVLSGLAAGDVTVWAELGDQLSAPLGFEVFAQSELDYCDVAHVNRGEWSDDFNRVTLESDCATYTVPDVVALRFTVTETQRPGGIFNPCLDLDAYRGETLVRAIRAEGCGDPFVAPEGAARDDAVLKYQLKAFWDLKDDRGAPVAPGAYTIRGRFYLYYDPVVSLDITVDDAAAP
ncbi:MAG: hypothetical protein ABI629_10230 [bacterium]